MQTLRRWLFAVLATSPLFVSAFCHLDSASPNLTVTQQNSSQSNGGQ